MTFTALSIHQRALNRKRSGQWLCPQAPPKLQVPHTMSGNVSSLYQACRQWMSKEFQQHQPRPLPQCHLSPHSQVITDMGGKFKCPGAQQLSTVRDRLPMRPPSGVHFSHSAAETDSGVSLGRPPLGFHTELSPGRQVTWNLWPRTLGLCGNPGSRLLKPMFSQSDYHYSQKGKLTPRH